MEPQENKPLISMPGNWPHFAVFAFVVDEEHEGQKTLIIHRSPNVRSAKDCWALPGGLHDIGETINDALMRELREELGLELESVVEHGVTLYENIAHVDGFHWVMAIKTVVVKCLGSAQIPPEEADKCDGLEILDIDALYQRCTKSVHALSSGKEPVGLERFGPHLAAALITHINQMTAAGL